MDKPTIVRPIVLFDGECGMCSSFVRFVLSYSTDPSIIFISLQSEGGCELLAQHGLDPSKTDSIVFLAKGKVYVYSSAILEIARSFRFPWTAIRFMKVVPRVIRDFGYRLVARYRKRLRPLSTGCLILSPEDRNRIFID